MIKKYVYCAIVLWLATSSPAWSQVVQFRLETTDMSGIPVDTVNIGENFMLKTYTQHVNGYASAENAGVFAAYLDITYDADLTSIAGEIEYDDLYATVTSGDFSTPGLMDNIGGLGLNFPNFTPIGTDEKLVFSVPMRADTTGLVNFVGADSESDLLHPVLVYGSNDTVPAKDVDFGATETRIAFDSIGLNVVPEPQGPFSTVMGVLVAICLLRKK